MKPEKNLKDFSRKIGGIALIAGSIGVGTWIGLIIADLLIFLWLFSTFNNAMETYSVSEYPGKLIALIFAAAISVLSHSILKNIIKRDKRWIYLVSAIMAAWFAVMYVISSPYTSGLFNPFSGRSRAMYLRQTDGKIKLFPIGLKFDPGSGRELQELDPSTAEEYHKQNGTQADSPRLWFWQRTSRPEASSTEVGDDLTVWVEYVELQPKQTVIHFACKAKSGKSGYLRTKAARGTYLIADNGDSFDSVHSSIDYDSTVTDGWGPWGREFPVKYIREDEVYHFTIIFMPVSQGAKGMKLHLLFFEPILDLDSYFATAIVTIDSKPKQ